MIRKSLLVGVLSALVLPVAAAAQLPLPPVPPVTPPGTPPVPLTPGGGAPAPYGADDAGGFRNVLPPGAKGVDDAADLARFQATGQRPEHYDDQQPLYDGLIAASPHLTHAQIGTFFKDATFGVPAGQAATTMTPRAGVTIVRDKAYGVPHVYGVTRADTMYGAGYAGAEDRLFLMDILRHTGRAQLSSFAGGSASNREMDRTQWSLAPYTEPDLQRQIDDAPKLYGAGGRQLVDDATAYVAGINAYLDAARLDPSKLPAEYAAFGKVPEAWKLTDIVATASLIGAIFGKGGGRELDSAVIYQALVKRFGTRNGRRVWKDFRQKRDPETITTVRGKRFNYETTNPFAPRGLAMPDRGSVRAAPTGPPVAGAGARATGGIGDNLMRAAAEGPHASNWELVSARKSATGHPIAVMGPQVGYYVPQILMEEDLHGPGIDARGASFPGVNLYVQLGHGRDYAWSATTAYADNVDTFAEVLCQDATHYLWKGQCRAMEQLDRTNSWTPNASDSTAPGSETLTAYRTVHGIVTARGTVRGKRVAFVQQRSTYFHEADSALGFKELNDPGFVHDAQSFRRAIADINFGFNWAYVDSAHIAYQNSGWYPNRATGVSTDFPVLGTGRYDWKRFDPSTGLSSRLTNDQHPHVIDQDYLVSWNNDQAPGFAAADDNWSFGSVQRAQLIDTFVRRGLRGGRKLTLNGLVQAMEEPATQDIRGARVVPSLLKAIGRPRDQASRQALALLKSWSRRGAHRRDLNGDKRYDDDAAVTLMDAWWPKVVSAVFARSLQRPAFAAVTSMIDVGDHTNVAKPDAPAFYFGWWGYVHKDLRTLFNRRAPRGRFSRVHCGGGSRGACRRALQASLRGALKVSRASLYAKGDCEQDAQASCFDRNRSTVASAIDVPPAPFQNRPTFQQTVELTRRLPR